MKVIACATNYGEGGLGHHLALIVEEARQQNRLTRYYAAGIQPGDPLGEVMRKPVLSHLIQYTPLRFSPGKKNYFGGELSDRVFAGHLHAPVEIFTGFVGQSEHSFQRARKLGAHTLELEAANSYVSNVLARHAWARRQHPIEQTWMNKAQADKTLREYKLADTIIVASEYTKQSFLDAGVPAEKLRRRIVPTRPRFIPSANKPGDGIFRILYVGQLSVAKGVPLLLKTFSRMKSKNIELTLVGGWATRPMRLYLQEWLARDPRIKMAPGDPLPHLHRADVFVHPTYEDGWGSAPAEAVACHVPVVVTEDTGMKELVTEGVNGYIVPTGSWEAILERLEHLYEHPNTLPIMQEKSLAR